MRFLRRHLPLFPSLPWLLDSIAFHSLKGVESFLVKDSCDVMTVNGLYWLFQTSNNPTVPTIVFQSIGGVPVANSEYVMSKFRHDDHILVASQANTFSECLDISENSSAEYTRSCRVRHGSETKLERLLKSIYSPPHGHISGVLLAFFSLCVEIPYSPHGYGPCGYYSCFSESSHMQRRVCRSYRLSPSVHTFRTEIPCYRFG
ncbi:hypothetical protein BDZ89DRAFT_491910 [Hymenopellis radicata]|nr:hypothetical protein BDZ89DRAFT_491910 [Hymenopellis radicata]